MTGLAVAPRIDCVARYGLVEAARRVADDGHDGQFRADGLPYITHPAAVVSDLAGLGACAFTLAAAWLHDTVEDCDTTLDDLVRWGFPSLVVAAVDSVTVRAGESAFDAVRRAARHRIGVQVKRADRRHNSRPDQLTVFTAEVRARRLRKYAATGVILDASPFPPLRPPASRKIA